MSLFIESISPDDLATLARYNAERARGIVHTETWQAKMAELQVRFDEGERRRLVHMGAEFVDNGLAVVPPKRRRSWFARALGLEET